MSFRSSLMKAADSLAGPPICQALSRAQTHVEHRRLQDVPGPVLVIRPGGIGDAAMLLPMLAALEREVGEHPERFTPWFKIALERVRQVI